MPPVFLNFPEGDYTPARRPAATIVPQSFLALERHPANDDKDVVAPGLENCGHEVMR